MSFRRSLAVLAWLTLLVLPGLLFAGTPKLPSPAGPVTDLAGIIDNATRQRLLQVIRQVEERTSAEIAILTVPTTAPQSIQEYSVAVFDQWKIGKRGKDNGLLFLVAVRDRRMWITTGYGLEEILPDGKVGEIRDRAILPRFRAGRYAEGILRGTQSLAAIILGDTKGAFVERQPARPRPGTQRRPEAGEPVKFFLALLLFGLITAGILAMVRQASRQARRRGYRGSLGRSYGVTSTSFGGFGDWSSGSSGGGFSSGSFGGFGGGSTGGGGAGGSW